MSKFTILGVLANGIAIGHNWCAYVITGDKHFLTLCFIGVLITLIVMVLVFPIIDKQKKLWKELGELITLNEVKVKEILEQLQVKESVSKTYIERNTQNGTTE